MLHTWSLSLEEQYYLLVPALLFLLPKRCWLLAAAIASMASLALCLWLASTKPYVAFFLLPARAWELGIGSVAALAVSMPDRFAAVLRQAFWPLLSVLVGLCLWRFDTPHPGWQALAICLATVGIIVGRHGWMATNRAVGCLAWVGDLSYSLYLVHWPIFAFMHNTWLAPEGQPLGWSWQLALIALSLVLAWALNRFVEEPFRHAAAPAGKTVVRLLSATLVLLALAFALPWTNDATRDFAYEFRVNYGFDKKCEYENDNDFRPPSECINSATPEVLIWGDSFAMHLVPGLAGEGAKLVQATRSMCAPARGLSVLNERYVHTVAWAKNCMALSESVLGYVSESPSIRYVVLSSPFMQLLKPDDSDEGLLVRRDHAFLREKRSVDTALSALLATASELRRAGKKVIVIAPPPLTGTDFGRCFERSVRGLRTLGVLDGCVFPESIADEYQREVLELLRRLDENGVPVIDLRPALCEGGMCRISIDGLPIYRDSGHLSVAGSEFLGKRMHWLERIKAEAR